MSENDALFSGDIISVDENGEVSLPEEYVRGAVVVCDEGGNKIGEFDVDVKKPLFFFYWEES
jgi:hypothetical protein